VIAIDPKTGEKKWQSDLTDVTDAGILTTDSDLLLSGSREEYFYALDARSGSLLWKTALGGAIMNGPHHVLSGRKTIRGRSQPGTRCICSGCASTGDLTQ
jgi:outer membrane protein assembly factor BamB